MGFIINRIAGDQVHANKHKRQRDEGEKRLDAQKRELRLFLVRNVTHKTKDEARHDAGNRHR